MGQSRLVLTVCCVILVIALAACNQGQPQPFLSTLPPVATSTAKAFESPVGAMDTPVVPSAVLPAVRPTDTPDPATTPLIIANRAIGDDGHEVVRVKNISSEKMDLSDYSLYNPQTKKRFAFPSGYELASGMMVEVHSGISREAATGGLFWTEEPAWAGDNEDLLLLNPAGGLVFWYVFKH